METAEEAPCLLCCLCRCQRHHSGALRGNQPAPFASAIGQPVTGRAGNSAMTGEFGFWSMAIGAAASVDATTGAGSITAASIVPNPVRDDAAVTVTLAQRGEVRIAIYDVNGKKLSTLYTGVRDAGSFSIPFNVATLPGGTYYVVISVPGALVQRPVTVVR